MREFLRIQLMGRISSELFRLSKLADPFIKVEGNTVLIDVWCDGDEHQSEMVMNRTRTLRHLVNRCKLLES